MFLKKIKFESKKNMSDPYVNPEPPPELASIPNEDIIGGTLIGKHSLFEILLLLIKVYNAKIKLMLKFPKIF